MRKISLVLGALTLSSSHLLLAFDKNYPCSGAPGIYRVNPDSSQGGFVANSATIDSTVFIELEASICDQATVIEGAKVTGRAEISGRATLRGKVHVSGQAKVYGEAYLVNYSGTDLLVQGNAKIYGNSFLQGSVVVADSSEVYGWGKVINFAQVLGESKVCGSSLVKDFEVIMDDESYCAQI